VAHRIGAQRLDQELMPRHPHASTSFVARDQKGTALSLSPRLLAHEW
jgi:hypothetical protein